MKSKKSDLQKRLENPKSSYWMRRADVAWGALMHTVYDKCAVGQRHGKQDCAGKLEAHHLISRAVKVTRHCRENIIMLCSFHHKFSNHLSPHNAPLEFAEWLQNNYPKKWIWVQEHKSDWKYKKPDYKKAYEELK